MWPRADYYIVPWINDSWLRIGMTLDYPPYRALNKIGSLDTVWRTTLLPGKFGELVNCSWIPQILTIQIFCYYKF